MTPRRIVAYLVIGGFLGAAGAIGFQEYRRPTPDVVLRLPAVAYDSGWYAYWASCPKGSAIDSVTVRTDQQGGDIEFQLGFGAQGEETTAVSVRSETWLGHKTFKLRPAVPCSGQRIAWRFIDLTKAPRGIDMTGVSWVVDKKP